MSEATELFCCNVNDCNITEECSYCADCGHSPERKVSHIITMPTPKLEPTCSDEYLHEAIKKYGTKCQEGEKILAQWKKLTSDPYFHLWTIERKNGHLVRFYKAILAQDLVKDWQYCSCPNRLLE